MPLKRQVLGSALLFVLTFLITLFAVQQVQQVKDAYGRLEPKPVMTWSLDDQITHWNDPSIAGSKKEVGQYFGAVINLPDYWTQAGIKFDYRQSGPANFYIHLVYPETVRDVCGDKLDLGCETHADPGSCVIWVSVDGYHSHGYLMYRLPPDELLMHEMGHCFGFQHTHGGLMNPTMDYNNMPPLFQMEPTDSMIQDLRSRMNRPWWTTVWG